MKARTVRLTAAGIAVLFFVSCSGMFTNGMDNPVDPNAESYQGYTTVDDVNAVEPALAEGAALDFMVFPVSEVIGADVYRLQIASAADFSVPANVVYQNSDFTTSVMAATADLTAGTTYFWRGAAHEVVWGTWTAVRSFTMNDFSGRSPPDGALTTDTTPTLSWDAVSGAVIYEVQIANTGSGVEEATAVTITAPDHSYTWPTELSDGDELHWRVKAIDADGTEGSWSSIAMVTYAYAVGDTGPAGGIVFYDKGSYSDGWRYLEAAPSDQSSGIQWGGYGTTVGGTSTATGTGAANTAAIVARLGTGSSYAARVCAELVLGGYDDWFLPSRDELNQMYQKQGVIGGFASDSYWSSSEYGSYGAWGQHFYNGLQYNANKDYLDGLRVRACRAF